MNSSIIEYACRSPGSRRDLRIVAHQPRIVVVELDERLGDVEVERAARQPRLPQLARQRVHRAQIRQQRLVFAPLAARVARQRRRDARDSRAARANGSPPREKSVATHVRVAVEVDAHHHRQPVVLRDQRADARRQRLGQHRDRAVGQVDAAPALARLGVERRPLAHVVRDVGDRDPQPRAAVGPAARSRPRRRSRARSRDRWSRTERRADRRGRRDRRRAPRCGRPSA